MDALGALLVVGHLFVAFLFATVIPALVRERYVFQVSVVLVVIWISLTSSVWIVRYLQAGGA